MIRQIDVARQKKRPEKQPTLSVKKTSIEALPGTSLPRPGGRHGWLQTAYGEKQGLCQKCNCPLALSHALRGLGRIWVKTT
jgi:hypothetical protein